MVSVFCSNTPESRKCILRGPDINILQEGWGEGWGDSCLQRSQVAPLVPVFSFSAYSKAFATYL